MIAVIILTWTLLSGTVIALYAVHRKSDKPTTWAELILVGLCFPGVVFFAFCWIVQSLLTKIWRWFDKPIRKD